MGFRAFGAVLWLLSAGCLLALTFARLLNWTIPFIGSMLSRDELSKNPAPILVLVLFAWVLIEIALKARQVQMENAAAAELQSLLAKSNYATAAKLSPAAAGTRASERSRIISAGADDPAGLYETLPSVASLDAAALASRYTPLNVYAWILPVLGFIGTATGMANSIGGFSKALGTADAAEDFAKLTDILGQMVIPGLASAFGTTILALVAALVAFLCTSAVKEWDQEALHRLNTTSLAHLAAIPPRDIDVLIGRLLAVKGFPDVIGLLAELPEQSKTLLSINRTLEQMGTAPAQLLQATAAIKEASTVLKSAADELLAASKEPITVEITRAGRT